MIFLNVLYLLYHMLHNKHHTSLLTEPRSLDPPLIPSIGARYVDIVWVPPLVPNGVVMEYRVYQNNLLTVVVCIL